VLPTFANEMKMEDRLGGSWNDVEQVKMGLRVWLVGHWWRVDVSDFLVSFVSVTWHGVLDGPTGFGKFDTIAMPRFGCCMQFFGFGALLSRLGQDVFFGCC